MEKMNSDRDDENGKNMMSLIMEWIRNGIMAIISGLAGSIVYLFHLLLECYKRNP